jgi:hypothetical protein
MAWNPAAPANNSALASAPIRDNFAALDPLFQRMTATLLTFPEGAAPGTPAANTVSAYAKTDGRLYAKDDTGAESLLGVPALTASQVLFGAASGGTIAQSSKLLFDATPGNLRLNGAGVGTSGQGVLALGPSTAPTTSPVDTVQLWAQNFADQAGSAGLHVRDERGGRYMLASYDNGGVPTAYVRVWDPSSVVNIDLRALPTAGIVGVDQDVPLQLIQNAQVKLTLEASDWVTVNTGLFSISADMGGDTLNVRMAIPGGHEYYFLNGGTGSGFGPGAFRLYDSTAGKTRIMWAADGNLLLGLGNIEARIVSQTGPDSAGPGWRYLVIAN